MTVQLLQRCSTWYRPRLQGYVDALHDAGFDFAPELVRITSGVEPREDGQAMAELLALAEPPTAVVCTNDLRALAVLDYCLGRGLRVPDDLAVTGSDNRPETAFSRPPLTTIDGRHSEKGRIVADLLARRLRGDDIPCETILIQPRLVPRESSCMKRSLP